MKETIIWSCGGRILSGNHSPLRGNVEGGPVKTYCSSKLSKEVRGKRERREGGAHKRRCLEDGEAKRGKEKHEEASKAIALREEETY